MRRISLAKLLVLIAALAASFAAVRTGSELWFHSLYAVTLMALGIAVLGAILGTPPKGAWQGFALFGWCYFALTFVPGVRTTIGAYLPNVGFPDVVAEHCHTVPALPPESEELVLPALPPYDFFSYREFGIPQSEIAANEAYHQALRAYYSRVHCSQGVNYLLACWAAAWVGSLVGRALARHARPLEAR